MAGTSQTTANSILSLIFGGTSYSPDATIYLALTTATPVATGGGTIVEPTSAQYNGYARVAVTNNTTNWPAASAGSLSNGTSMAFPTSAGGASSPVTVTYVAAMTVATIGSGIIRAFAPLPGGTTIATGITPTFAIGGLDWTVV